MQQKTSGKAAGFTLVELIVVIAILGILAGIAIPVYSGYIKKAHEAADNELLAAVNTAFGAACLENGVDMALQPDYYAGVTLSGGKVAGVTKWNSSFLRYFAGNENTAFSTYTALWFKDGVFAPATGETTVGSVTVSNAALANYMASTFNSGMNVSDLTGGIDTLVARVLSSTSSFLTSEEYSAFLSELGLDASTMTPTEKANALALLAASQASDLDKEALLTDMANGRRIALSGSGENAVGTASALYAMMMAYANTPGATITTSTPEETIKLQVAALGDQSIDDYIAANYPVGTTYVPMITSSGVLRGYTITTPATTSSQSALDYFTAATNSMTGLQSVTDMYDAFAASEGFRQYISTQGESDLDGFIAAMSMISDNTGNVDLSQVLSSGWSEGGIGALLEEIINN
mgnify:CR=1 FL=1